MKLTVGLAQCDAVLGDVAANAKGHRAWIDRAREAGVQLLVFPELSLTGYLLQDMVPEVSRNATDAVLTGLSEAAGDMALCVGGIEESAGHGQFIASFYLEGGRVSHIHRKAYLASYGVFDEARYVGEGDRIAAADTRFGRIGFCICEDAWHPSLIGTLMLDGADVVVVQTASPVRDLREGEIPRNALIWQDTLRCYARLYGSYILFCNRVGTEDGLVFWGRSVVLGPEGDLLAEGPLYDEDLLVAELDPERVRQARLSNPVLREERLDLTVRELQRIASKSWDAQA